MQIVIDISKDTYDEIMYLAKNTPRDLSCYESIIARGIPLPKGHGRLIDADELKREINQFDYYDQLCDAPTIIEADKESRDADSN